MARQWSGSPWNVALLEADRLAKGWNHSDLAAEAGVSVSSVTRFVGGEVQTPGMAKKLADALGQPLRRYVAVESRPAIAKAGDAHDDQPILPFAVKAARG
jgi:transcriptional regulator with XRE-family HTH domain